MQSSERQLSALRFKNWSLPLEEPHTAIIAIGSNLGDKIGNCRSAIEALCRLDRTAVLCRSSFYKTSPVDYLDQDWFINAAVKLATALSPFRLLEKLQEIQRNAGRVKDPIPSGPRIIDLDIIFYDDAVIETSRLVIPHPRMHKRAFVLRPICDIDPQLLHPVFHLQVQKLLDELGDPSQGIERIQ
jgi:2-amino-4-hydroxy-6-hydroxymethyldihydropteridine diphosphokinase